MIFAHHTYRHKQYNIIKHV